MAKPTPAFIETADLTNLLDTVAEVLDTVRDSSNDGEGNYTVYVEDGRDTDSDKDARSRKAFVARELLRAQTAATLLAAELGVRYQTLKGAPDPREGT